METYLLLALLFINSVATEDLHYDEARGLPNVEYTDKEGLARMLPPGFNYCNLRSAYDANTDTIYFLKDRVPGMDIVIHEMVHFVQDRNGLRNRYKCAKQGEVEAYVLQNIYAEAVVGHEVVSEWAIEEWSRCDG